MPELSHHDLPQHLKQLETGELPHPVYLLYGEPYLVEEGLEALVNALLEPNERLLHYESVSAEPGAVQEAVDRLNTFSLVPGKKVVALPHSRVFHTKGNAGELVAKARLAEAEEEERKAVRLLLDALSLMDLSVEEASEPENRSRIAAEDPSGSEDDRWLTALLRRCVEWELSTPEPQREDQLLSRAVERGFPDGHVLILTTGTVDKRRQLFRKIREAGAVVDCGVPAGAGQADRNARAGVFADTARALLDAAGKRMNPPALRLLGELTGSDLRNLARNVEKLIAFSGPRDCIEVEDVTAVVERTRKDPIYAFTDSVTDRDFERTLFTMRSLLADPEFGHPLPLIAALANQMRRLLVIRSFLEKEGARLWHKGLTYPQFQRQVLPAFQQSQEKLASRIDRWREAGLGWPAAGGGRKKRKAAVSDLLVSQRLKSPYPLFLAFQKCDRFRRAELVQALCLLQAADLAVKTSQRDPVRELERLVLFVCRPNPETP